MPSSTDRCPTLYCRPPLSGYIQPSTITSVATVTEYICHLPRMSHPQSINPQKRSSWLKDMIWAFLILIVTAKTLHRDDWLLPMLELLSFSKKFLLLSLWIYYLCMTLISTSLALSKTDNLLTCWKAICIFFLNPRVHLLPFSSNIFFLRKTPSQKQNKNLMAMELNEMV